MSCCANIYELDYQGCGQFSLPGAAPVDGTYILQVSFNGTKQRFFCDYDAGSDLDFELPINEYNDYTFELILPDGSKYQFTDYTGNNFDCFRLNTEPFASFG